MLAEPADEAFTRDGWLFELKLDGYRLLASKMHGEALLLTRNGNDYTGVFPEIARAVAALPVEECSSTGKWWCSIRAASRALRCCRSAAGSLRPPTSRRAAVEVPATFFAFDLLAAEGYDVRSLALVRRKRLLRDALPKLGPLRFLDHIERDGEAMLASVTQLGLEGIIAKKTDTPYKGGRSSQWLKIKSERSGDFVIVGFTQPKGSRSGLGALQLADYVRGALVYAGRVGTGFNDSQLMEIHERLPNHRCGRRHRASDQSSPLMRSHCRVIGSRTRGRRRGSNRRSSARCDSGNGRPTASCDIPRFFACESTRHRTIVSGRD